MNIRFFTAALVGLATAGVSFAQTPTITHTVLAQDRGHVAIVAPDGTVTWEAPCPGTSHDIQYLRGGNILVQTSDHDVVEMNRDKQIVWRWDAKPKEGVTGQPQIHAFQRLRDGNTMIAETVNKRIIEVDKDGKIVRETPITVDHPDAHRDTRRVRKLANGNYLACHEGDGMIREYEPTTGKVVWSYKMDLNGKPETGSHQGHGINVFSALRLPSGNTLIGGGNNNRVFEVNPAGKTVWSVEQDELPGVKLYWVTNLEVLRNGDILIGNTHAGPDYPQLIEITKDKKVVWTFKDWKTFGNDTAAATLTDTRGSLR